TTAPGRGGPEYSPDEREKTMTVRRAAIAVLGSFFAGVAIHAVWIRWFPPPRYRPGDRVSLVGLVTGSTRPPYDVPIDMGSVGNDYWTAGGADGTIVGRFDALRGSLMQDRYWVQLDGVDEKVIVSQNNLCPKPPGPNPRSAPPVIYKHKPSLP